MGIASTLSGLDSELIQLNAMGDEASGERDSGRINLFLNETLLEEINKQIHGHRSSIDFLFECLQR